MNNLSYSKVNIFQQCPYKFKKIYIDGEKEHTIHFDIGTASHRLCEMYLKKEYKVNELDEVVRDVTKNYNDKYRVYNEVKEIITPKTLKKLSKLLGRDYKLEKFVKKDSFVSDFSFVGRVDLLIKDDVNNAVVVDFKTSKKYNNEYSKDWKQLLLYAYLLNDSMNIIVNKLSLWFLRDSSIFVFDINEEVIQDAVEEIRDTCYDIINTISLNNFRPTKNIFCSACKFKNECGIK